jgi:hypothetical protein
MSKSCAVGTCRYLPLSETGGRELARQRETSVIQEDSLVSGTSDKGYKTTLLRLDSSEHIEREVRNWD